MTTYFHRKYGRCGHLMPNTGSVLLNLCLLRCSVSYGGEGRNRVLRFNVGPGAGYIGGWSAALSINGKGRSGVEMYRRRRLRFYAGRNANKVPYIA